MEKVKIKGKFYKVQLDVSEGMSNPSYYLLRGTETITKRDIDLAYEKGRPLITDKQYDTIFGIQATGKVLEEKTPWEKFEHTTEMASLEKINVINSDGKLTFKELVKWVEKVNV